MDQLLRDILLFGLGVAGGARLLLFIRDYRRARYGYSLLHVSMSYILVILMFLTLQVDAVPVNFIDITFTIAVLLGIVSVIIILLRNE